MVKVAVIGGGSLGIKIIGELAYRGNEVRVYDRSPETLDRIRLRIQEEKRLLAEDGLLMTSNFLIRTTTIFLNDKSRLMRNNISRYCGH